MLNPIEQNIANGMSPLLAFLTESTCGEACWEASEDVCRCSCGGKNHGCLRSADGTRPVRNAKLDGTRYELAAVGHYPDMHREARTLLDALGPKEISRHGYKYFWGATDKDSPVRVKAATKDQLAKWPELAAYRDGRGYICLLWKKA